MAHCQGSEMDTGFESSRVVFPVFIHNGSLNSFLHDQGARALESHGYSSVVGQPPSHVLLRPWLKLVATRLQHSMHSPKKKNRNLESCAKREWALGSFMWFIWKQRMKEVHNVSYCFIPDLHVEALSAAFLEEPTLTSHNR